MIPLQLLGLALAGRLLSSKYPVTSDRYPSLYESMSQLKQHLRTNLAANTATIPNPVQTLVRGLTSSLSQIRTTLVGEDYNAVVKHFLPENAKILSPRYPINSEEYLFADLDGDSRSELIASFRHDNKIKTIVLKKQNDRWHKTGEISSSEFGDIKTEVLLILPEKVKKQLLIGFTPKEREAD